MKNIISKIKYGVSHKEYKRIQEMREKEGINSAILECKFMGYKLLTQHLQQKLK